MEVELQQQDPLEDVPESVVADDVMDNPMNQDQDIERNGKQNMCSVQGMLLDPQINLKLSVEATRKLLNRKPEGRPKPLLRLVCKGCGLSTHDPDPIVGDDWLEWSSGYYKLTSRMRQLGVSVEQPTGDLCKCCSETGRRAYPKMKREALISSLEAGGNFLVEFSESRSSYIEEVKERLLTGNMRVKKRCKTIKKDDVAGVSNKVKGTFMELEKYKKEFGSPSKNGLGHVVTKTTNPLTCQPVEAVFVPKLKAGMWNGEISNHSFVTSSQVVDDDCNALRKNQLQSSLDQEQKALMDSYSTKGVAAASSLAESRQKLEEEAAAAEAKRKAMAEGNKEDDGEDDENEPKRMKCNGEDEDEQDDIDEDAEVMYMQALQDKDEDNDAPMFGDGSGDEGDKCEHKNKKQKVATIKGSSSSGAKPAQVKMQSVASSPKSQAVVVPLNLKPSAVPVLSTPTAPKTHETSVPMAAGKKQPVPFAPGDHTTWSKCDLISSLEISSEHGGKIFAPPSLKTYQKNANNVAKWRVEVAKQKPWLMIFESLFASDQGIRVTEQQAKTALTRAKKGNNKVDKRLGYETANNGELTFHERVCHLKEALQATKEFRSKALGSAKGGPIAPDVLEKDISQIKKPLQELVPDLNPAFPLHWGQAWVTAACQPNLSDDVPITDEATARACASQLYLFDTLLKSGDHDGPAADNAYGRMTDFFFFCPGSLQDEKICRLQSKFIGKLLMKAFAAKLSLEEAVNVLKACLPENPVPLTLDALTSMVLDKAMAEALWVLYQMLHGAVTEELMEQAKTKLTREEFVSCHRPLYRLVQMSQYKRLVHSCHQKLSLVQLDRAAGEKAEMLKEKMSQISELPVKLKADLESGNIAFLAILDALEKVVGVKTDAAALPSDVGSMFYEQRSQIMESIEKELLPELQDLLSTTFLHFLQKICGFLEGSDWQEPVHAELSSSGISTFSAKVKGGPPVLGPGKYACREVLGCCSFSLRSLAVYIADLCEWLMLHRTLEGKTPSSPFVGEIECVSFAEAILDSHRCNKDIAEASATLRTTVKTKTEELAVNVLRQKPESKHILLTLKPWVSEMEEDGTKQLYSDLLAEIRKKEQDELSGDGSNALGGAFSKAFGNMEELLGPECHLLQHLTGASLEKLVAELGAMKSLGACYKDLAKQIASVDKSLAGLDQVNQAVKMEECAKLLLACQSGLMNVNSGSAQ